MAKKNKQDWDVRTNIGAGEGSQGTLFSGGKQFSSPGRFPRGYTPERRQQVMDSFVNTQENAKGDMPFNDTYRKAIDTVSRSTVPIDHLRPKPDQFGDSHRIDLGMTRMSETNQGSYRVLGDTSGEHRLDLNGWQHGKNMSEYTVIHELGHHHDLTTVHQDDDDHTLNLLKGDEHAVGAGEGYADAYAQKHFVPRDQKARRAGAAIPTYPSVTAGNATPEFRAKYFSNRALSEKQFGIKPQPQQQGIRSVQESLIPASGKSGKFGDYS